MMFLNLSPPDSGTVFDMCPTGSMMVDGVCVGDPSTYGPPLFPVPIPMPAPPKPPVLVTTNISPENVDETGRNEAHMRQLKAEADAKILAQQNTGISPLLILAAAAAFFIGG